jgi:hypothetical protein
MANGNEQILRVVVASPGDVARERALVKNVVDDLNANCGRFFAIRLELYRWEDVPPGLHEGGAQGLIDERLGIEEADILIGIFWKRFGTSTASGETGTEHEIRVAHRHWRERARPQVMLYFSEQGVVGPNTEDLEQMIRVRKFRDELQDEGVIRTYTGVDDFAIQIRNHLTNVISGTAAARIRPESIPCAVSAYPKIMRSEGMAEFVGEILLTLPKRPDQNDIVANVQVSFNTNITSSVSELGLAHETQLVVEDITGAVAGPIVSHGRMIGTNAILFESVNFPLNGEKGVVSARLLGIRANACALSPPDVSAEVYAFIRVETDAGPGIGVVNPQVLVGVSYPSFAFSVEFATVERMLGANAEFALGERADLQLDYVCTFRENFPDAFKSRAQESVSGAFKGASGVLSARNGTLLSVRFSEIPEDVTIYATTLDTGQLHPTPSAELRFPDPKVGQVDGPAGKWVPLQRVANSATAVWEWINVDPKAAVRVDTVSFGFAIVAKPGSATLGFCNAQGSLRPFSSVGTASRDDPVPRFLGIPVSSRAFVFR